MRWDEQPTIPLRPSYPSFPYLMECMRFLFFSFLFFLQHWKGEKIRLRGLSYSPHLTSPRIASHSIASHRIASYRRTFSMLLTHLASPPTHPPRPVDTLCLHRAVCISP